jgi:Asp-tRNA(Asn)/Glu-tRNA(Gln) amidotransferase A subunit family amidase
MALVYDAFGNIGTTFRELEWKAPIFSNMAVPKVPNASQARHHLHGGMPAGVLLWGAPCSDRRLLGLAMALEEEIRAHPVHGPGH